MTNLVVSALSLVKPSWEQTFASASDRYGCNERNIGPWQ